MHNFIIFCCLFLSLNHGYSQTTILVPEDYPLIQEALDAAEEYDTILVAPGTYFENLIWPSRKDLHLISAEGAESTIIDGGGTDRVIELENLTDLSLLEGFTIQNGSSNSAAGIRADNCGLVLKDLHVKNNIATGSVINGGGAFLYSHTGNIYSCLFNENIANAPNSITSAGCGLFLNPNSDIEIYDCGFNNNEGHSSSNAEGGGLYIDSRHNLTIKPLVLIKRCTISNNSITAPSTIGAGMYVSGSFDPIDIRIDSCFFFSNQCLDSSEAISGKGGAIAAEHDANLQLSKSSILDNKASFGSGIYAFAMDTESSFIINHCKLKNNEGSSLLGVINILYETDLLLVNSEISHNQGSALVLSYFGENNSVDILNSTIAYNDSSINLSDADIKISESILWSKGEDEFIKSSWDESIITVSNSIIKGGYSGTDNIDSDPLFISEEFLIPSENSPCINAGNPMSGVTDDLLGNPRPLPIGTNPDIGAYEVDQGGTNTEDLSSKKFKVFPNPTQDWVFFEELIDHVEVHNSAGLLLKNYKNTSAINLEEFPDGIYTLIIHSGSYQQNEKVIIVR